MRSLRAQIIRTSTLIDIDISTMALSSLNPLITITSTSRKTQLSRRHLLRSKRRLTLFPSSTQLLVAINMFKHLQAITLWSRKISTLLRPRSETKKMRFLHPAVSRVKRSQSAPCIISKTFGLCTITMNCPSSSRCPLTAICLSS